MKKKEDTYSYKGWLISDHFVKRCFATLGYHMMAGLFIWLGLIAVGLIVSLVVWIFTNLY